MNSKANGILREVFERILEEIVFAAVEDVEEVEDRALPAKSVTVRFEGPTVGSVELFYPAGFGNHVASSMLGSEEEDLEPGDGDDAACELLNVLSGNLLTALHGAEAVFRLQAPRLESAAIDVNAGDVRLYDVDGFLVGLKIVEKQGVAP